VHPFLIIANPKNHNHNVAGTTARSGSGGARRAKTAIPPPWAKEGDATTGNAAGSALYDMKAAIPPPWAKDGDEASVDGALEEETKKTKETEWHSARF
jgi:hypothetical protein